MKNNLPFLLGKKPSKNPICVW